MTERNQLIVVAAVAFVLGVVGGLLLPGLLPADISTSQDREGCWEITVRKGSDKKYVLVKASAPDEKIELEAGKTVKVCEDFDLYESLPVPPDPPKG